MSTEQVLEVLNIIKDRTVRVWHTTVKLARRGTRIIRIYVIGPTKNPGWQGKALHRWSRDELVDFLMTNMKELHIGIKFITRLEDHEMDGSILAMMFADGDAGDAILCKSLKVERYVIKKLRNKLAEMNKDHEKDIHEQEIINLLQKITVNANGESLDKYQDTLLETIGVSRVTELPSLIEEEGFFDQLNLSFVEEARLKHQIRSVAKGVLAEGKLLPRHLNEHVPVVRARPRQRADHNTSVVLDEALRPTRTAAAQAAAAAAPSPLVEVRRAVESTQRSRGIPRGDQFK